MEKELLDSISQKLSFILSALNGTKEAITEETLEEIREENDILLDALEAEQEELFVMTEDIEKEHDKQALEHIVVRIINNVLLTNGFYDDAEEEELASVQQISVLDESDIDYIMEYKDNVIKKLEENKDLNFYDEIVRFVEEIRDEAA